jgi:glyoxalase family protein
MSKERNTTTIDGIHHVTAMAGDPQRNVDFYSGLLGLRLVKVTVNYDDPGTYHLYYGDGLGSPGTIMTFFPWPHAMPGRVGAGMTSEVAFAIPAGSADWWKQRLNEAAVGVNEDGLRYGQRALQLRDPDGMGVALVEAEDLAGLVPWGDTAVRGIHSVTLAEANPAATEKHLTEVMGLTAVPGEGERRRYQFGDGGTSRFVDVVPATERGRNSAGTIHHVAWRVANDETELYWQRRLMEDGRNVSPVMDRTYFHSIYWREPGGVLFEIATDAPGFDVDEKREELGSRLVLPPWMETSRKAIEQALPKLGFPVAQKASN